MNRKRFLLSSLTLVAGAKFSAVAEIGCPGTKPVRFGIVTDLHYADRDPLGTRYYKQSLSKLAECVELMNEQKVDFLIELGDFKDQNVHPNKEETLHYLTTIESEFRKFKGAQYHVLGNHDMDSISKEQFLGKITNTGFAQAKSYYSFNKGPLHFVVLDANYTREGISYNCGNFDWKDCHIPEAQLRWLEADLKKHRRPTIVFVHQQLDSPAFEPKHHIYCPDNADKVRMILEKSGIVMMVFQGHYHEGSFNTINGIPYYTLKAVIEGEGVGNNSYAIVEVGKGREIKIMGFRKADTRNISRKNV